MISLKRIIEQQDVSGQYYDLGVDYANFRRMIDGSFEQVKQKFEQSISSKLVGKRIKARASRGYKQYVKDYEFDVTKITIDDYYDNYVIVAHDNATPKPKEYFLKSGFKITIIGPATGQPSPQKGGDPNLTKPTSNSKSEYPTQTPNIPQQQQQQQPNSLNRQPVKEDDAVSDEDVIEKYPSENIIDDILWLKDFLKKPNTINDFKSRIEGWKKKTEAGQYVVLFNLNIPQSELNVKLTPDLIKNKLKNGSELTKISFDKTNDEWKIQIKKLEF